MSVIHSKLKEGEYLSASTKKIELITENVARFYPFEHFPRSVVEHAEFGSGGGFLEMSELRRGRTFCSSTLPDTKDTLKLFDR